MLQGFIEEQFNKAQAPGVKDGHLYKMAGNAISVPVITAIGQKIYEINAKPYHEQYNAVRQQSDNRRNDENIKNDEVGVGSIDFNKIIPMPENLKIESGSDTERGYKAYKGLGVYGSIYPVRHNEYG